MNKRKTDRKFCRSFYGLIMINQDSKIGKGFANGFKGFFGRNGKGMDMDSCRKIGQVGRPGKRGFSNEIVCILSGRNREGCGNLTVDGMFHRNIPHLTSVVDNGVKFVADIVFFMATNNSLLNSVFLFPLQTIAPMLGTNGNSGSAEQRNVGNDDLPGDGT